MQCIERGLIRLEDDVSTLLPEIVNIPILTGFDDGGKPILTKRTKVITLRFILFSLALVINTLPGTYLHTPLDSLGISCIPI